MDSSRDAVAVVALSAVNDSAEAEANDSSYGERAGGGGWGLAGGGGEWAGGQRPFQVGRARSSSSFPPLAAPSLLLFPSPA